MAVPSHLWSPPRVSFRLSALCGRHRPFVLDFSATIVRKSPCVATVCADDIAISCRSISQFVIIFNIFILFAKCVLMLVSALASPCNIALVRQWLSQHIPEWSTFEIGNSGVYLEFQVGPRAGKVVCKSALRKFSISVDNVYKSHECFHSSLRQYNSKATTLGYISQLALPPPGLGKLERGSLNRIFHLATNAFSFSSLHHLRQVLGIKIVPLHSDFVAIMCRAAHCTVSGVDSQYALLCRGCTSCLPLSSFSPSLLRTSGWDSGFC